MKRLLLAFTLGAALASSAFAQSAGSTNTPPSGQPPGDGHHEMFKFLTDAERAEFNKARDAAIAADPSLGTDEKALMDQMSAAHDSGERPSADLRDKMHAFRDKMNAAMVKADPAVAPVLEKIKAHHHAPGGGHGDHDGGNGGSATPAPAPSAQ